MRAALGAIMLALGGGATVSAALPSLDLAGPFRTRGAWQLTTTQGPAEQGGGLDLEPGAITLCISKNKGESCAPELRKLSGVGQPGDAFDAPHYIDRLDIVHPRADQPLLLLRMSSLHGGNGSQAIVTRLLAYDRAKDAFGIVFQMLVGHNMNEEVRFMERGPLEGDIIAVEPTQNAPFGFWVTVYKFVRGQPYRQILRYRSATRYGDGNPLAVIDSEMPNIQQRLGLWRPRQALPLPEKPCAKPHLKAMALWCG